MTRFRTINTAKSIDTAEQNFCTIMLVEDSAAMALMLKSRIEAETTSEVEWYKTYAEASQALADHRPTLAVTGMNLPDAPDYVIEVTCSSVWHADGDDRALTVNLSMLRLVSV